MTSRPDSDLVSIIIPVYNGSRFVAEAIDSALAQSWPAIEVVVVDDGSNDGGATQRAIARFGNAVRVISKSNGGVATALNAGIAAMRGAWFAWLSHDDLYLPHRVERYMKALRAAPEPAIAFGDVDYVDDRGKFIQRREFSREGQGTDGRWMVLRGLLNGCAMLVPRACLEVCGDFDAGLPTTQDYAYWFRLAQRFPFVAVPGALVRSRVHDGQGSRNERHIDEASLLWIRMVEDLEAETPDATPEERLKTLQRVSLNLRHMPYAGANAWIEARIDAVLRDLPVALVCAAASRVGVEAGLSAVAAAGCRCDRLVLIDRTEHALAALDLAVAPWPQPTTILRLRGPGAGLADALKVAAGQSGAPLFAVLDSAALPSRQALRDGLVAVAAGASASGTSVEPASGNGRADSRGAIVVRRDIVEAAVMGDDAALAALARDEAFAAVSRSFSNPPPMSDVDSYPSPQRPGPSAMPTLARPPRPGRPTLLMMVHNLGGGTIRYAATLGRLIADRVNILYGWGSGDRSLRISSIAPDQPEAEYDLGHGMDGAVAALRQWGVGRVDVIHSIGFDDHLDDLLDRLAVPFDVTLTDYHHVATNPHLVGASGRFVGDDALLRSDHPVLRPGPLPLRLRAADRRIACSRDLAGRMVRLAPGLRVIAARLPERSSPPGFAVHAAPLAAGETMRVLCLGAVAVHKGLDMLTEVVALAAGRKLALRIDCLGAIIDVPPPQTQLRPEIRMLGGYAQSDLSALICRIRPHLAWFPFTAPETHSFALSDALAQGLPILATGIGAVPERVAGRPSTWLVTPQEATAEVFVDWLDRLQREKLGTPPRWLPTDDLPPLADDFYPRDYLRPLFGAPVLTEHVRKARLDA